LARASFSVWGIAFLDVDDDGWPDLVIANGHVYPEVETKPIGDKYLQPTLLLRNLGNGRFANLTAFAEPAFATPRPARGLAFGDLDGDGRPEIVIVNMNSTPSLLKNQKTHGNFLNVAVKGTRSNRSGIGARVKVTTGGREMISEVMSGGSFLFAQQPGAALRTGNKRVVDRLQIRWPSGTVQSWDRVAVNQKVIATEGSERLQEIKPTAP
jgi:enediyne biosynthesis protein E4